MDPQNLLQKSKSLIEIKQYSMAKEYAQAVLEHNQSDIEALFLLAQCDEVLGKTKAMASSLFKILSLDTSNIQALDKLRNAGFLGEENSNSGTELVEKILDDGSVYLLPMNNDRINGFGVTLKNGFLYAGMFKDSKPLGRGVMKGSNGYIYVGNFDGGNLEGEGTLITENFQMKTTFSHSKPDGKSRVEMRWGNGNKVLFWLVNSNDWVDFNNWEDTEFIETDGTSYQVYFDRGDSVNLLTGEVFLWKDDGNFRDSYWDDSMESVLMAENHIDSIQQDDNHIWFVALLKGFACTIIYSFDDDCLISGGIMVSQKYDDPKSFAADYDKLASFFNEKYGRPTKESNRLIWDVDFETKMIMPKWKSGIRQIAAIYQPSSSK